MIEYAHPAGETAHIFEIDSNGKPLFVLSLDEDFDGNVVVQPSVQSDLEKRVSLLENQLKSLVSKKPKPKLFNSKINRIELWWAR